MPTAFHDNPCKRVVRETWDTPVLEYLHRQWGEKFLYFGLPGPQAHDIRLWAEMIRKVFAFEDEDQRLSDPRQNIAELRRQLTLLGIQHAVFCGPLEEVVLLRKDRDGTPLSIEEFVAWFNLDFCNAITGRVTTQGGRKCLRFEALRAIIAFQRELYRATQSSRFIMLITVHDTFTVSEIRKFIASPSLSQPTAAFIERVGGLPLPRSGTRHNTGVLKAFMFTILREYLRGQNVASRFLPPVAYVGASGGSPMLHFVVVCTMQEETTAQPVDEQTVADFLRMRVLRATESGIEGHSDKRLGRRVVTDPLLELQSFARTAKSAGSS